MTVKRKNLSPGWSGFLFGIGLVYFSLWSMSSRATDAGLINNGVQQYFDNSGNPLTSGKVYFYEVGTSTFKDTYTSSAATTINQNPITLNAGGKAPTGGIYGIGLYRQLLKDRNGNVIWDAVTSPGSGGGSTPTDVGDGNLVGTVLPWSGLVAPNQYVFAYGQELSRTTYPEFYTAVTLQANVSCSASSNTLTGIADTTQIPVGAAVELSLCVIPGTTVVSKTASTVTLSNPSSVSINAVAVFYPYGNGNGTTTFNVPDLRDVVLAGRPNMGGSDRGLLTTTYYGTDPAALGALGGLQTVTLSQSNLPNVTLSTTIAAGQGAHTHSLDLYSTGDSINGAAQGSTVGVGTVNTALATLPAMTGTTALSGSNVPFSIIQPTLTLNYIIKVTPDTSTSIATGVYSIGGMTGVISCGTGILCTGNIISFNGNVLAGGSTGSIQFKNSDGSFGGSPNALFISPNNLTLGAAGTSFLFDILGSSSGRVRQTAQAAAGTPTVTWGTSSGTPAVTAATPIVLNSTTGDLTCPTCATGSLNGQALTRTNDTNVTLTLGGSPTTALLSPSSMTLGWIGTLAAARLNSNVVQGVTNDTNVTGSISTQNLTLGWTGQLAVGRGGTGLSAGISGGIPYYNSTSTMASSGVLGANQIVLGGGAGAAPTSLTCATSTTVVHGGTPPTCSQIVAADVTTNTITNSNLSQVGAATIKGNPTSSTANVQDFTFGSLTQTISPGSTDWIPIFDNATGTIKKVNAGSIASASVAGVSSIAGNTGAFTLSTGLTNSANDLRVDIATGTQLMAAAVNKVVDASTLWAIAAPVTTNAGSTATVTITIASPGVVSWTAHGLLQDTPVVFTTTGALPTGIVSGTIYYVCSAGNTTNAFQIATTVANADAGTCINTTGSQSGVQTGTAHVLIDLAAGSNFKVQLVSGFATVVGSPVHATKSGQSGIIAFYQPASGSPVQPTYETGAWKFPNGTAPPLTQTTTAKDLLGYYLETGSSTPANALINGYVNPNFK